MIVSLFQNVSKLRDQWRTVFFILAAIYVAGTVVYVILASGKAQPWADGIAKKVDGYEFRELNEDTVRGDKGTYRKLDTSDEETDEL